MQMPDGKLRAAGGGVTPEGWVPPESAKYMREGNHA